MTGSTTQLELLPELRQLDAPELTRLVLDRRVPLRGIGGLVDLAEWLRSPAGVERAIEALGWQRLHRLGDGDPAEHAAARSLLLTSGDPPQLLPEIADALALALASSGPRAATAPSWQPPDDAQPEQASSAPRALGPAAEAAFASVTLAGELLRALDAAPRAARADRGRIRLAGVESRRIAGELGDEAERIAALARLTIDAGLAASADGTLRPTAAGRAWLQAGMPERWRMLAGAWLARLAPNERRALLEASDDTVSPPPGGWHAPVDERDSGPVATGREYDIAARCLGIVTDGVLSPIGRLVLDDRIHGAAEAIAGEFPTHVDRVYIHPDCSIVAPGPLRPDLDDRLREAAELERPGLAPSYRITRDSIHRSLASGATRDEILELLDELCLGPVPQPVRYLVEETAARHGTIRVQPSADRFVRGCRVLADDDQLLDTLVVDRRLVTLGLARVAPGELLTRVGLEASVSVLREAGHPVAAEGPDGAPWHLERHQTAAATAVSPSAAVERLVAALLDDPAREGGADSDETWLRRQLELARRSKEPVRIVVEHAGTRTELSLVPTSVAGPRLRGRDVAADVERTIPIASIAGLLES